MYFFELFLKIAVTASYNDDKKMKKMKNNFSTVEMVCFYIKNMAQFIHDEMKNRRVFLRTVQKVVIC